MVLLEQHTIAEHARLAAEYAGSAAMVADAHFGECMGGYVKDCRVHSAAWAHWEKAARHHTDRINYIMANGLSVVGR